MIAGVGLIVYSVTNKPPLTRGAIAGEHWHASLKMFICGKQVTNYPTHEGELHSHGDGFMHIHPQTAAASGDLASLGTYLSLYQTQFTQDAKGKRTLTFPDKTHYSDGDKCGKKGRGYDFVFTNKGDKIEGDPSTFLPHDGDVIVIRFGPEKTKGTLPNPFAVVNQIPDAGVSGNDTPAPDGGAPPQSAPPVVPTTNAPGSGSPEETAKATASP